MNTLYMALLGVSLLIALGLVAGLYAGRWGFSHLLVFLALGMLAGVDGPLGLPFEDHKLAFALGNIALAMILLDGGLRTTWPTLRMGLWPASVLATVGVLLTALITGAVGVWALGLPWLHGLLLGAVLSSTDAAAVFNRLSNSGVQLPPRVSATLEVESGLNDPVAVVLTLGLILAITKPEAMADPGVAFGGMLLRQAGWGAVVGLAGGWLMAGLLRRLPIDPSHDGLSALLLSASGMVVFAGTGLLEGSGFLAVYLFGLCVARRAQPQVRTALPALNAYTWIAQAGLFLLLGLLVTPHQVWLSVGPALAVAAALMLLARPLAVWLCLSPLGFGWREQALVGWVGLRGAVPIVLAVYPFIAGVPGAYRMIDVALVVVVVSLLVQGPSLGWVARRLGLDGARPP